jgi:hypothetical protein
VAPVALARLAGAAAGACATTAAGWQLGEAFEGRSDTSVFGVQDRAGAGTALLKAAGSRQGRLQLVSQVRVLAALHADERLGPWRRLLPDTLCAGEVDGLYFVLESRLPGRDSRGASADERARTAPLALDAIGELQVRTSSVAPVDAATVERWVHRPAREVRAVVRGRLRGAVDRLEAELVAGLAGREVPRSWAHGDYNRTNVLLDGGEISGIVDWPAGEPDGLIGADAVTLFLFEPVVAGEEELGRVLLRMLDDPDPVAEVVGELQAKVGPPVEIRTMLLLTWLRHVGNNLADSTRYAGNPVWMHRNVRAVLQAV